MLAQKIVQLRVKLEELTPSLHGRDLGESCSACRRLRRSRRLKKQPQQLDAAPADHRSGNGTGFAFILLGPCTIPEYNCTAVLEMREAIASLRVHQQQPGVTPRAIAILSDGAIPAAWLMASLRPDRVVALQAPERQPPERSSKRSALDGNAAAGGGNAFGDIVKDLRTRKLLAYGQTPFARTIFLDGDEPHSARASRCLTPRPRSHCLTQRPRFSLPHTARALPRPPLVPLFSLLLVPSFPLPLVPSFSLPLVPLFSLPLVPSFPLSGVCAVRAVSPEQATWW